MAKNTFWAFQIIFEFFTYVNSFWDLSDRIYIITFANYAFFLKMNFLMVLIFMGDDRYWLTERRKNSK